jgi:hypothetical protein
MKITKYILSFAAAIGMLAGCYKPELEIMAAPEDVVPPTIEAFNDLVFTLDNVAEKTTNFNWSPVDYGARVEIDYAIEVCLPGAEKKIELSKGIHKTTTELTNAELNAFFRYTMEIPAAQATEVEFYVSAKFLNYEKVYSAPRKVSVTTVDPAAPVLSYTGEAIEINVENVAGGKAPFSWTPAVYSNNIAMTYSIEVALPGGEKKAVVVSGIASNKSAVEVSYKDLNSAILFGLEIPENQKVDVEFYVAAQIGEYAKVYSAEPVVINVSATTAEKEYPKAWVIGDYCGWNHGNTLFLFNYEEDDKVYQGVIDFGEKAANGWKITGVAAWDDSCNWGGDENVTYEAEATTSQLISSGGSKDLKHYSLRYYHFSFDKTTLVLTKNLSFTTVSVIGANGDWTNDIEMTYSPAKQRFYADVEFKDASEFKFRLDKSWDTTNWGVTDGVVAVGGGNIPAAAGKYRIYLNLNNLNEITYELNPAMFGQEEGGTPETPDTPDTPTPPVMTGWGIVGSITNWGNPTADNTYIPDVALTSDGTWYAAKAVEIPAGAEIKFRKDGQWASQWGLGADAFAANTEMTLSSDGGSGNITPAAGTYDIYLNPETGKAWFINDGSYPGGAVAPEASVWGIVGQVNGWAAPDITMYKTATEGLFVAYKVEMPDGGFKIRANGVWDDTANYGLAAAGAVEVDHAYDLVCSGGSGDMTLVAGTYDIWFDLTNSKVYIMTPGKPISEAVGGEVVTPPAPPAPEGAVWGVVGSITDWKDNADINMTEEGDWYVAKAVALTTSDEFKFRTNGVWGTERTAASADPVAVNTEYAAVTGSGNIKVAVDGTFDLYLAKSLDKFYVMEQGLTPGQTPGGDTPAPELEASEWGIVGAFTGWGSSADIVMYKTATEGLFVAYKVDMPAGPFKIRANNEWNDAKNYGLSAAGNVEVDHVYDVITSGGSGDMTIVAGTYDIWFDLTNKKVYVMTPDKPITEAVGYKPVTPDPDPTPEGNVIYLKPNNNWKEGNARFALYTWDGGDQWFDLTDTDADGIYEVTLPTSISNIIFCRMNPATTDNNWSNKWNQTSDLKVPTDGTNMYTVKEGTWDKGEGTWSTK